jgi:hypothetical protein
MADGQAYSSAAPLGFEAQIEAAFRVGGMATQLAAWLANGGAEATESGISVLSTKVFITVAVVVAEALIAAKEAEIALLQATPLPPQFREPRIQQLQQEIKQLTDAAKKDIESLYNGIYTPTTPKAPGIQPLKHTGTPPNNGTPQPMGVGSSTYVTNGSRQSGRVVLSRYSPLKAAKAVKPAPRLRRRDWKALKFRVRICSPPAAAKEEFRK